MNNTKLAGLLSLANGARKLLFGEIGHKALADSKSHLLLISDDASARTTEKLINRAKYYNKTYLIVDDKTLNQATANTNKKFLVVMDQGFSKSILDIYRER